MSACTANNHHSDTLLPRQTEEFHLDPCSDSSTINRPSRGTLGTPAASFVVKSSTWSELSRLVSLFVVWTISATINLEIILPGGIYV